MMNLAKMEKEKISIYILIKDWFDWCKHNRDKNNPTLSALYFWIIEKCNSLGWVNSFGLPTDEAMHILGIGSYNTYKKNLLLLQEIGFINIIEFSKNQYTSNVIGLSKFDKAGSKHLTKQVQSTSEALDKAGSKQIEYNNTINTINTIKTINTNKDKGSSFFVLIESKRGKSEKIDFDYFKDRFTVKEESMIISQRRLNKNFTVDDFDKILNQFFIDKTMIVFDNQNHFFSSLTLYVKNNSNVVAKNNTPQIEDQFGYA